MASKVTDRINNMFTSIGAMQTLVENFPMSLFSFGNLQFATSFDVIAILFKILGVDREEFIEMLTNLLCNDKDEENESGFISLAEKIVKGALQLNLSSLLDCTINPIISNNLLDFYGMNADKTLISGDGFLLNVSEIDFTGVLSRNPFHETDKKFYFDVDDYNASTLYKSKDFNAFLWYIINRSDKSNEIENVWDNRITDSEGTNRKEIIRCTYIDDAFPNQDKIKVQICGGRKNGDKFVPDNFYKTRRINDKIVLNKTIFEFNHQFLSNIKLYDKNVIIAEIVEYFFGQGNLNVNLGFSVNEKIIQGKIQSIIKNVIETDDMEVNDCHFSFSNDEYNEMLEKSEENRYNVIKGIDGYYEANPNDILIGLTGSTSNSTFIENKESIKKTFQEITAIGSKDPMSEISYGVGTDWEFELIRMLAYPFIRPLFTPKVIFILLVNKKVMGSFNDFKNVDLDEILNELMNSLFKIIKDIILKLKDLIVDMMMNYVLEKLKPLLSLFASRLLLESLKAYKDLLEDILNNCKIPTFKFGNKLIGTIDDVNYADIIPTQVEPKQSIC